MNTKSILESLLFVSGEPLSFKKLSKLTSLSKEDLSFSAKELAKDYTYQKRGLRLVINDNKIQMVTAGENREYVEKFLKADIKGDLSKAALEVMSIIAYRGPISRAGIEEIRGVNSSFILRLLTIRGLAERISNPNDARSYLYKISLNFLKKLGIEKVEDLPDYAEMRVKKIPSEFEEETENSVQQKEGKKTDK